MGGGGGLRNILYGVERLVKKTLDCTILYHCKNKKIGLDFGDLYLIFKIKTKLDRKKIALSTL